MLELELPESILAHDCDEIQGYYFSKPLPQVESGKLLDENRALDF